VIGFPDGELVVGPDVIRHAQWIEVIEGDIVGINAADVPFD
jgi:hypothetical protein